MAAVSLKTLATKFQVATSTISRALAGDPGVSPELARKIKGAADAAGYRPMPMRRRVNHTVGLVVSSARGTALDDLYHASVYAQTMAVVTEQGWHLNLEVLPRDGSLPRLVLDNRVDGVLLCGFPDPCLCAELAKKGFPTVCLDDLASRTGLPSVISEIASATGEMVRQLIEMGHRRIAYVTTSGRFPTVADRLKGFVRATKELKLPNDFLVYVGASSIQQGQAAVMQLMRARRPPTAIVFATDRLALGGILALARLGLSIPGDVSIVGHDNIAEMAEVDPPVTTVDLVMKDVIAHAFHLLQSIILDPDGRSGREMQMSIPAKVVWRNSCGPCPLMPPTLRS